MPAKSDTVIVTWRSRASGEWNRLTLGRRLVLAGAGLVLASVTLGVVAGATALRLHQENARLHQRVAALEGERDALAARVQATQDEIARAREGLERVRAEEAKIRSWLGLEVEEAPGPETRADEPGGKGSLGDVDLRSVAPADRTTEAEAPGADALPSPLGLGDAARSLADDLEDLARLVEARRRSWDAIPAISPVDGEHWISSGFGWRRSPFTGKREFHNGVDMAGRAGTPIVAPADGKVVRVVRDAALGRTITIDHGNGIRTIYGHLQKVLVKRGQRVKRGEQIATMGSTGRRSTGPHVHYAVKVDGKFVNPWHYMLDRNRTAYPVARSTTR